LVIIWIIELGGKPEETIGNVGIYVSRFLIEMNQEVIGAVTSINKSKDKFNNVELVNFDFLDKNTFDKALDDVDRVFLMRPPHLGKPEDLYCFIDTKDIGFAIAKILYNFEKHQNTVYTITGVITGLIFIKMQNYGVIFSKSEVFANFRPLDSPIVRSATPGSIEGLIYTNTPLAEHLIGVPEVTIQMLAFSWLFFIWERKVIRNRR
jgi:hypothetical protein